MKRANREIEMLKGALGFIVLAVIAGTLIGVTREVTRDSIAANEAAAQAAILQELLGGAVDPDAAKRLCRSETRGYGGLIRLLVLPRKQADGSPRSVTAVRVLSHSETPGIGDFIDTDKSPWINQFSGLTESQRASDTIARWDKQIDAVSGATITRRAMIKGVAEACPKPERENP